MNDETRTQLVRTFISNARRVSHEMQCNAKHLRPSLPEAKVRQAGPARTSTTSHPPNMRLSHHLAQLALHKPIPPLKQHSLTNQPEPRRVLQVGVLAALGLGVVEHLAQLVGTDPAGIPDLVFVDVQRDIGLDEQDVVDLMLAPFPVRGRKVVDAREEGEIRDGDLGGRDAQLVVQFALRGAFGALDVRGQVAVAGLGRVCERVRAAGVGPHVGEGDLLGGALLEEQFLGRGVEDEGGEGAVQEALVDVAHQVAGFLGRGSDGLVVGVEDDAHLVHEADLLLVVAGEEVVRGGVRVARGGDAVGCHVCADEAGVHVGEEGCHIFTSDCGGGGGHDDDGVEWT